MSNAVVSELEHARERLSFYQGQQDRLLASAPSSKKAPKLPVSLTKWIEIYSERVRKLERQVSRLGLRTEIAAKASSTSKKRA